MLELKAEIRTAKGTNANRRLRKTKKVPGVLYGAGKENVALNFEEKVLIKQMEDDNFYTQIFNLKLPNGEEKAIVKEIQHHPYKQNLVHIDFQRVADDKTIQLRVPLNFVGAESSPAMKQTGVIVNRNMVSVEVSCLSKDLPDAIDVELSHLDIGEFVHLTDIKLPDGVELVELKRGRNLAVAGMNK